MAPRSSAFVAFALGLVACGGAPVSTTATGSSTASSSTASSSGRPEPATPTALAEHLIELAGIDPASVDAYVDAAFAERLPSYGTLAEALAARIEGCAPELSESPGGGAIAIPPPMVDDSPNESARIEGILDELAASTEIMATCLETTTEDDETSEQVVALWVIAVRADAQGRYRVLAWRNLLDER